MNSWFSASVRSFKLKQKVYDLLLEGLETTLKLDDWLEGVKAFRRAVTEWLWFTSQMALPQRSQSGLCKGEGTWGRARRPGGDQCKLWLSSPHLITSRGPSARSGTICTGSRDEHMNTCGGHYSITKGHKIPTEQLGMKETYSKFSSVLGSPSGPKRRWLRPNPPRDCHQSVDGLLLSKAQPHLTGICPILWSRKING